MTATVVPLVWELIGRVHCGETDLGQSDFEGSDAIRVYGTRDKTVWRRGGPEWRVSGWSRLRSNRWSFWDVTKFA